MDTPRRKIYIGKELTILYKINNVSQLLQKQKIVFIHNN